VVQVYVGDVESSVARPVRELRGFAKVALEPGESTSVSIVLVERAFTFWSTQFDRWVVEAGDFEISVGSSSRNLVATQTVTVDAPSLAQPLGPGSTLHEWLADERGRALLHAQKPTPMVLSDPELVRVIGTMPMDTLAAFGGMGFDHAALQALVSQL
jgi:beta-glucosidase